MEDLTLDSVIEEIDKIARDYDEREFGLPLHHDYYKQDIKNAIFAFTKKHVEAALKAASEKAKITERKKVVDNMGGYVKIPTIYKKHILSSYPLENIK